ncbi:MAG: hypothetical protein P8012_01575 [Desulfobacterales bacterium]
MNLKKIIVCFTGLAVILVLIACSNGTAGTEPKTPDDQSGKILSQAHDANPSEIPAHGQNPQTPGGHAKVPFSKVKVEKSTAPNGYTVAELFAKGASLNKQKVTVRGQVVKVNPNIMGRNWIHIQDGTGDPAKNTHDLVATSADTAKIGTIISIEGTLAADKDFGFGYKYDVIVENAVLMK